MDPSTGSWSFTTLQGPDGPVENIYSLSVLDGRLFGLASARQLVEVDPVTAQLGAGVTFDFGSSISRPLFASGATAGSAYMLELDDLSVIDLATGAITPLSKHAGRRVDFFSLYEGMVVDTVRRRAFAIQSHGYVVVFDLDTGDRAIALR